MGLKKSGSFNKGRGQLARGCFLGERVRGSFVSAYVEQDGCEN
jgi:hypothetical protein